MLGRAQAASGTYEPRLYIQNGGSLVWYDSPTGTSLGTISSGTTFQVDGGSIKTWQNGSDDTLSPQYLKWRAYDSLLSSAPGFTHVDMYYRSQWYPDSSLNKYWDATTGVDQNIPKFVTVDSQDFNGVFTLEFYVEARFNWGSLFNNNGGSNWRLVYNTTGYSESLRANSGETVSNSTSYSGSNGIGKFGAGTVDLTGNSGFSGRTLVNQGMLKVGSATALGNTTGGTKVQGGATLALYNGIGIGSEALEINGSGDAGLGALRNLSGSNSWAGAVTLSSNSRINSDSGTLTLSGTVSGGSNVLFVGGSGNTLISNSINGDGTTQDGTVTSLFKDGGGTLSLSGSNSYTGDTRINAGNLTVASGGSLGNGSDVFISSSGSLTVNTNTSVASFREWGNGNGGTIAVGSGATLTMTGANLGPIYQNSISGAGGITVAGSGTTALGLYGTQSYTGTTTVSGGKISSGVAMGTSSVVVSGGEFEATADNLLPNSATLSISSGTLDLQGSDTVASLTATGGAVTLGTGKTLVVGSNSSIGAGATITGGTLEATGGTLTFDSTSGNSSALTIGAAATLKGSGTIGGATTLDGIHAPGNSIGNQNFSNSLTYGGTSIFEWEIDVTGDDSSAFDTVAAYSLAGSGAVFKIILDGGDSYDAAFWNSSRTWSLFTVNTGNWNLSTVFSDGFQYSTAPNALTQGFYSFSTDGHSLQWTPVPEPGNALVGFLLGAGLWFRKRPR